MSTKILSRLALLTALALILSFVETLIPNPFPIPGAKLGLANIIIVFTLETENDLDAFLVNTMRLLLAGFLFMPASALIYSLIGAYVSLIVMILLKIFNFSILTVSIFGGIFHNLAQLATAVFVTETPGLFLSYGPYLMVLGFLSGLFVGLCSYFLIQRFKSYLK